MTDTPWRRVRNEPGCAARAIRGPAGLVALVLVALVVLATPASTVHAQARVFTTFGQDHGLSAPPVWALGQDSAGFIWVGAEGGLFRFDGTEIRRWAPEVISTLVTDVTVSPTGTVAVLEGSGTLYEVTASGVREVPLPWPSMDGPRRPGGMIAFDTAGTLWMRYGDAVGERGTGGWRVRQAVDFQGDVPRGVVPARFGGAFVLTDRGLWRVESGRPPRRIFTTDPARGEVVTDAAEPEPGRVLILLNVGRERTPRVVEVTGGLTREMVSTDALPEARAIAIAERNGTIWLALDVLLVAARPGERPELIGPPEGFESGGPLLVGREGSLWLGSFVGLHHYPEPDTRSWTEPQGLPSRHARFVARSESTLWVTTWHGAATVRRTPDGWRVRQPDWISRSHLCTTGDGRAWTSSSDAVMELRGDTATPWPDLPVPVHGCTAAPDGGVWLGGPGGLVYLDAEDGTRLRLEPPFPDESRDPRPALLHDRRDRLWVGAGESLCHASAQRLLLDEAALWSCESVATPSGIFSVVELDDGRLWAAAGPTGLLENRGDGWRDLSVPSAPTQTIHALVPSLRGGVWILGTGMLARARPAPGGGLEILERLTPWHGIAAESGSHLFEDPNGDLWLATNRGAVHIPASVRFEQPPRPRVALVEARIDDRPVPVDEPLVLPHDRNRLELRFAALSFRHRAGLRHQVRLSPDETWSESTGEPTFRWVDLPAGTYHAQYRASRDGRTWSAVPTAFTFQVEPPWYATSWFLLLAALSGAVLVAAVHRARVSHLLGLERQRTRIAMDLHDQVGSGLASVGILSGVLATDGLAADQRRRTAMEIADVAEELGYSLSDIVWALDPETSTLGELAARLAEHGDRLFASDDVDFRIRFPAPWPHVTCSVAVRRSVLLIGLEALHNAARHAGARCVTLSLDALERGAWALAVHDDGAGIHLPDGRTRPDGNGRGLAGMERRATSVGAMLEVGTGPRRGTTVTLRFHPRSGPIHGVRRPRRGWWAVLTRMIMRGRPAG